jgi:hypothetical protein
MGAAGRARVDSLFTMSVMTYRNEALYHEILRANLASAADPARHTPQPAK